MMRVALDAKVLTRDGEDAGSVERAVVNPEANEVTAFVVSTGALFGRDVLVPLRGIERASPDGDAIRLALTKEEIERLPAYVPADYVVPPADWVYTGAYAFGPYGGFVWPAAYGGYQYTAGPGGSGTAPGQPEEPTIGKGAVVFDRDGEDLGVVDDVLFDPASGRLRGFVLRVGGVLRTLLGGGDTVEVTREAVDRVAEGAVHLRLRKDEVARGAG
jgi:uncharacterized protein YrrD